MEFGPILSALSRHKTGTFLVALQIAVSLAIMVNAAFIIQQRVEKMNRPTGMDVENLIAINLRGVGEGYDSHANIRRDLDMLRNHPDVLEATYTNHFPLSGSGSGTGLRTSTDENETPISTARYNMDDRGISTLGVNLVRGRDFYPEEVEYRRRGDEPSASDVVIVTQAFADELFPDEDALGKTVYWGSDSPATIIGIIDHMHGSWVNWDKLGNVLIHPRVSDWTNAKYMVRAKPGRRDALLRDLETELSALNKNRVIRYVRAHEEMAANSYAVDRVMMTILAGVIVLLVGLTALVIVGLASYFVSQRTKQIGTRRALGATKFDIVRYFLVENWLITTMGAIAGCILTAGVGYMLETSFDLPRLDWMYLIVAVIALWVVSQFAAYWPARRASNVPPAVATRSV